MFRRQNCYVEFDTCHGCPRGRNQIVLPFEMLEAVNQGNISKVKQYIEEDNDINAVYEEDNLLSRACADGQKEILELLLQCPDLHLNMTSQGMTPLMIAARNEHFECMKLLLDSSLECELRVDSCWHAILKVLATNPELKFKSVLRILESAGRNNRWEVVKLILATNHHFTKRDLESFVMAAVNQCHWDVAREVFKREFLEKNLLLCQILPFVVRIRCWERIKEILHVMDEELKFSIPLAEAVLSGKEKEVRKLYEEGNKDPQMLNGILLVAAAGGTTDQVAKFLLSFENTYTQNTLTEAIIMASSLGSVGLFPHLLSHKDAHFSFQDLDNMHKAIESMYCYYPRRDEPFTKTFFEKYLKEHQNLKTGGLNENN